MDRRGNGIGGIGGRSGQYNFWVGSGSMMLMSRLESRARLMRIQYRPYTIFDPTEEFLNSKLYKFDR